MIRIEHIAIWVRDLKTMRKFYCKYFNAKAGDKYLNPAKGFSSFFLQFSSGARLEIMSRGDIADSRDETECYGYAHLAISLGDRESVDTLTETLQNDGYTVVSAPRVTGDGYYESVVLDPEGNHLELTD